MTGSGEGFSPADPPFAQLGGETTGGFRDKFKAAMTGAFQATAPDEMKQAVAGTGDMRAFQKRRDMSRRIQQRTPDEERRLHNRERAEQTLQGFSGGNE